MLALVASFLTLVAAPSCQTPTVSWSGDSMRLQSASVSPSGSGFALTLTMDDDNGNGSLPTSYRRWWHCQVDNLNPAGTTLTVTVTNAGYTDIILPVWALSTDGGSTFGAYQRMPTSAVPTRPSSTSHRFTVTTPTGVDSIRIAKYFPYPVARKNAFVQSLGTHPHVRSVQSLGLSQLGRSIDLVELTDASVPDAGKTRIWIHAGIHPAETTSYFVVEGLIEWLGSGDPFAEVLLDNAIVDIVPMANPDGVFRGNYRTNANSSNLENQWASPYNSTQPEIVAMRTAIEGFMGTPASPGSNPIDVLLNLHSSHNVSLPFHYQHTANANWNPYGNNSGVIPAVHAIEGDWIAEFQAASPYVGQGATFSSSAGAPSRPFVESMMHDRWSVDSQWTGSPAFEDLVMAITFEGTYRYGPVAGVWNTEADYRQVGADMGLALANYLGLQPGATVVLYGSPCANLAMNAALTPVAGGSQALLAYALAPSNALGIMMLGFQAQSMPLPAPYPPCLLLTSLDATVWVPVNSLGFGQYTMVLPNWPGLSVYAQMFAADPALSPVFVDTSNGVELRNN